MSRDKILKNIKKNIKKRIPLKEFELNPTVYKNPKEEFEKNFKNTGGMIVSKPKGFVLEGVFAVAENGTILLKEVEDAKDYTFYEEITVLLDKNNILDNMHQAYKKLHIENFALFMAGPSKTADIEQSLVIGAHGAKKLFLVYK